MKFQPFLGTTSVSSPGSLYLTSLPSLLLGTVQSRSPPPHSIGLVSVGCSLYGIFPGLVVVDDRFHAQHFSTATICHLCYVLGACRSIFKSTSTNVDYPQSHSVLGSRSAKETGAFSVAWSGILFFYTHTNHCRIQLLSCRINRVGNVAPVTMSTVESDCSRTQIHLTLETTPRKRGPVRDINSFCTRVVKERNLLS